MFRREKSLRSEGQRSGSEQTEVSVFNSEGPPVPIPNTEVKLVCADNTRLEATREDRSMLTPREVISGFPWII